MSEQIMALQMDTCFSAKVESEGTINLIAWLEANEMAFSVIQWNGPGGGWPIIEYYGTREQLEKLLREQFGSDDDDVQWQLNENATAHH